MKFTMQSSASGQIVLILLVSARVIDLSLSHQEMSHIEETENTLNSSRDDPMTRGQPREWKSQHRFRRQERSLYVEIIGVVDHYNYNQHYEIYGSDTEDYLFDFYNYVFHEVNLFYAKYFALQIRLKNLLIMKSPTQFGSLRYSIVGGSYIDLDALARSVQRAIEQKHSKDILDISDHVVFYTGADFAKLIDGTIYNYMGHGSRASMCRKNGYSYTLIEDVIGDTRIGIIGKTIRFLAFSFNAYYDVGDCIGGHQMMKEPDMFHPNYFSFSRCTVEDINKFLKSQISTPVGRQCLEIQHRVVNYPDPAGKVLGYFIDLDHQCVLMFGISSRFCGENTSSICSNFKCSSPGKCTKVLPYAGTPCGTDKACLAGKCVNFIPPIKNTCKGDSNEYFLPGKSCSVIEKASRYCYTPQAREKCCDSCKRLYKFVTGCEFGDKVDWCHSVSCDQTTYMGVVVADACCAKCPANRKIASQGNDVFQHSVCKGDINQNRRPELCTNPGICQTNLESCCKYCSQHASTNISPVLDCEKWLIPTAWLILKVTGKIALNWM